MSGKFINSTSPPKSPFWMRQLEKGAGDVGLQLGEGGRERAVHHGLQVAPEAAVNGGEVGRSRLLLPTFQILRTETTNWIPMTSLVSQVSE